jgi:dUTP pyrophosphatase
MIQFKRLTKTATIPKIAHEGDAGFDLYADQDGYVYFGQQTMIATGIAMAIPNGYVGLIKPRSGLAAKLGVDTMAGVIDAPYRGEVNVILTLEKAGSGIKLIKGERIAQLIVVPVMTDWVEVVTLGDSERGSNGFGSTGM